MGSEMCIRDSYNNDTSVKITVQVNNVGNTDWDNVVQWVAEGNTIEEAD